MYASRRDFVCMALLSPLVLGFGPPVFFFLLKKNFFFLINVYLIIFSLFSIFRN